MIQEMPYKHVIALRNELFPVVFRIHSGHPNADCDQWLLEHLGPPFSEFIVFTSFQPRYSVRTQAQWARGPFKTRRFTVDAAVLVKLSTDYFPDE